jgi:hypothetical protein
MDELLVIWSEARSEKQAALGEPRQQLGIRIRGCDQAASPGGWVNESLAAGGAGKRRRIGPPIRAKGSSKALHAAPATVAVGCPAAIS